jgi:nicotinate-nucleotide adenylyltransferase
VRLGIFGGTFDPPHLGHLILAAEARYQLALDRILWVLTPDPPHKLGKYISPLSQRLGLVRAALADAEHIVLSTVDIDRPAPHYALDTVRAIRTSYPSAALFYIMGGDSFRDLPNWHQPLDFLAATDGVGVMRRPGDDIDIAPLEDRLPGLATKTCFLDAPLLEIASRDIRERIIAGAPFRYYLPDAVYRYIVTHHLYRRSKA